MTMSDASFATSVPDMPIASPTSASFSAGASLVPSPVTATTSFWLCSSETRRCLSSGELRARTFARRTRKQEEGGRCGGASARMRVSTGDAEFAGEQQGLGRCWPEDGGSGGGARCRGGSGMWAPPLQRHQGSEGRTRGRCALPCECCRLQDTRHETGAIKAGRGPSSRMAGKSRNYAGWPSRELPLPSGNEKNQYGDRNQPAQAHRFYPPWERRSGPASASVSNRRKC
mmetsp:Transcript_36044/g.85521  ORF Transcript_36044/g.85521 Transcript_36044/m.85521 type:complete len:229 (-) Transcript_36044:151-837(-)